MCNVVYNSSDFGDLVKHMNEIQPNAFVPKSPNGVAFFLTTNDLILFCF